MFITSLIEFDCRATKLCQRAGEGSPCAARCRHTGRPSLIGLYCRATKRCQRAGEGSPCAARCRQSPDSSILLITASAATDGLHSSLSLRTRLLAWHSVCCDSPFAGAAVLKLSSRFCIRAVIDFPCRCLSVPTELPLLSRLAEDSATTLISTLVPISATQKVGTDQG